MPTDRIMEALRPYQERLTLLEQRAEAAEAKLKIAVEALRRYADPDIWDCVFAECRDEYMQAWLGPEVQPWKHAEEALSLIQGGKQHV